MHKSKWFAVYTRPRYEKKVEKALKIKGIRSYLPLVKTLRQWSDRKKWVELPLFSSYIFVLTEPKYYYEVLNIAGVVRYISFEGKPVEIPQKQIDNIEWILSTDITTEPLAEKIPEGSDVEIVKGPLKGLKAEMVSYNNKKIIILRIDQLDRSVEIQIPRNHVQIL